MCGVNQRFATQNMTLQRRDILNYKEKKYALNCDIFKSYFEVNPNRKPKNAVSITSLHRGYFSEFKIVDNQLIAVDISIIYDFDKEKGDLLTKSVIDYALPDQRHCNWFNGTLLMYPIPSDEKDQYDCLKMEIVKGRLEAVKVLSKQEYHDFENHAYDYF